MNLDDFPDVLISISTDVLIYDGTAVILKGQMKLQNTTKEI